MRRLCSICARGGSKGVPNKNVRDLLGKPLLAYSIEQARATGLFEAIAVSSDADAILDVARQWGADYLIRRPGELATDRAAKVPAIQHCLREVERQSGHPFDIAVDLDATSPLRLPEDIVGAVNALDATGASYVITACPARRSPYYNLVELDERGLVKLCKPLVKRVVARQEAPPCFDMNASIYVWRRDALFANDYHISDDTALYVMPEERSVDIDSELDFRIVELLMLERASAAAKANL